MVAIEPTLDWQRIMTKRPGDWHLRAASDTTLCRRKDDAMGKSTQFDEEVKRLRGVFPPKCTRKPKAKCTPEEWARHLDYERNRKRDRDERRSANKRYYQRKRQDPGFLEANRERSKLYREENPEKCAAALKRHRSSEEYKESRKAYRRNNRDSENASRKRMYDKSPQYRIACILRARFKKKVNGESRSLATFDLVGCSPNEARLHIESLFQPGMSWDNYPEWHIDHIVPLASFDLTDEGQQKQAFHYTNLQPLWAEDNLKKRDKI